MHLKSLVLLVLTLSLMACKSTPEETSTESLVPLTAKPKRTVYRSNLPKDSWAELSFVLVDAGDDQLKPTNIKLVKESSPSILSLAEDFSQSLEKWRYSKNKVKEYENIRFIVKLSPPNKESGRVCNANDECKLNAHNDKTVKKWFNHLNRINSLTIACNISSGVGYTSFQTKYKLSIEQFKIEIAKERPEASDKELQKWVKKRKRQALAKIKKTIEQSPGTCDQVPKTLRTLKG